MPPLFDSICYTRRPVNATIETVTLNWVKEKEFILRDRNNFPIFMDQPMGVNAADLLPLSLIGCSAYDVVAILKKQRQDIAALEVSAQSTRDPEPPWRFLKIHIKYKVRGKELDPDKVKRSIHLAEEKYCGVYVTLKDAIEITNELEIIEV